MLILTRRVSETLVVGDDIRVTVLGVKGSQVRIGVDAPKHVQVDRLEVHDRKVAERCKPAFPENDAPFAGVSATTLRLKK